MSFARSQDPEHVLNDWSTRLNDLMALVNRTTHLINREEMVHKHLLPNIAPAPPPRSVDHNYEVTDWALPPLHFILSYLTQTFIITLANDLI